MRPGKVTCTSCGTLQGVYRPQARIYFYNARYNRTFFETLTKPVRCSKRTKAIAISKEWVKTEDFRQQLDELTDRILADPDNSI